MNDMGDIPDNLHGKIKVKFPGWMEMIGDFQEIISTLRAENARLTADLAAANERVKELERERDEARAELAVMQRAWELDISECEHTPCQDFLSGQKTCHQCCIDRARAELKEQD